MGNSSKKTTSSLDEFEILKTQCSKLNNAQIKDIIDNWHLNMQLDEKNADMNCRKLKHTAYDRINSKDVSNANPFLFADITPYRDDNKLKIRRLSTNPDYTMNYTGLHSHNPSLDYILARRGVIRAEKGRQIPYSSQKGDYLFSTDVPTLEEAKIIFQTSPRNNPLYGRISKKDLQTFDLSANPQPVDPQDLYNDVQFDENQQSAVGPWYPQGKYKTLPRSTVTFHPRINK